MRQNAHPGPVPNSRITLPVIPPRLPCLAVFWQLDEGRINPACSPSPSPARCGRAINIRCSAPLRAVEDSLSCAVLLRRVSNCSDAEVRGVQECFSRVREAFVVEVVRFGERGVKQGEMPIGN